MRLNQRTPSLFGISRSVILPVLGFFAAVLFALVLLVECTRGPAVEVLNDGSNDVWIGNCDLDMLLKSGETRTIRPTNACSIFARGKDERFLWRNAAGPGGYLGCLLLPEQAYHPGNHLLISKTDPNIAQDACVDIKPRAIPTP